MNQCTKGWLDKFFNWMPEVLILWLISFFFSIIFTDAKYLLLTAAEREEIHQWNKGKWGKTLTQRLGFISSQCSRHTVKEELVVVFLHSKILCDSVSPNWNEQVEWNIFTFKQQLCFQSALERIYLQCHCVNVVFGGVFQDVRSVCLTGSAVRDWGASLSRFWGLFHGSGSHHRPGGQNQFEIIHKETQAD